MEINKLSALLKGRIPIEGGKAIWLLSATGEASYFQVETLLGAGGSSLVYKATMTAGTGEKGPRIYGTLKEFYPLQNEGGCSFSEWLRKENCPSREPDGTLRMDKSLAAKRYSEMEMTCAALHELKRDEGLNVFIPYMGLYKNLDSGVPYLFTPEDRRGITLADYLEKLGPAPQMGDLLQVLNAVNAVAVADQQLCEKGALLLDIKPDNILLIAKGGEGYLQDAVSLFDVESLLPDYRQNAENSMLPCSLGYTAPELGGVIFPPQPQQIGPATDVYALGATLFRALTGQIYPPADRKPVLDALLHGPFGALLERDTAAVLSGILEQALQENPDKRFRKPCDFARVLLRCKNKIQQREAVNRQERSNRIRRELPRMMTHLLYRWPCHEYAAGQDMRVLVVSRRDGEDLIPAALNAVFADCHVLGYQLHLAVAAPDAEQIVQKWGAGIHHAEQYLEIQQSWTPYPWDGLYAQVAYEETNPASETIKNLVQHWGAEYLLVLEQDEEGSALARQAAQANCCRFAAWLSAEGKTLYAEQAQPKAVTLLSLSPEDCDDTFTAQAENIAFNAHLLYEKEKNPRAAMSSVRERFENDYNHAASMDTALSVKCRLKSAGIKWSGDAEKMAESFRTAIAENPALIEDLSWLEHRRWVASKLVQGARTLEESEYEVLMDGGQNGSGTNFKFTEKDGKKRLYHALLVPSSRRKRPEGWQTSECWAEWGLDEPIPAEMDPLDRAGILLYRQFARACLTTDTARPQQMLAEILVQVEKSLRASEPEEADHFHEITEEFRQSLIRLCREDSSIGSLSLYEIERQKLETCLSGLQGRAPWVENALDALNILDRTVFCFGQKLRRIDPKKLDDTLIQNLPFMLRRRALSLCKLLDSDHLVNNFASVRRLAPEKVVFAAWAQRETEIGAWCELYHNLVTALKMSGETVRVSLLLLVPSENLIPLPQNLPAETVRFHVLPARGEISALQKALSGCDAVDMTGGQAGLCSWCTRMREDAPTLFEMRHGELCRLRGALPVQIPVPATATVRELFAMSGACPDDKKRLMARTRYRELYPLYREILSQEGGAAAWAKACAAFNDAYSFASVFVLKEQAQPPVSVKEQTRTISSPLYVTLWPLLTDMEKEGFLSGLSDRVVYGDESGEATHRISFAYAETAERVLLSFMDRVERGYFTVMDYCAVTIESRKDYRITGIPNQISFRSAPPAEARRIFDVFAAKGLLQLSEDRNDRQVITFIDPAVRQILRKYGTVLETAVFSSLHESGLFDDIAVNFCYQWGGVQQVLNELDVVAVRGSKMALISCKAARFWGDEGKERLNYAIYEVYIQAQRLKVDALPVLVLSEVDLRCERPEVAERARALGVLVIDKKDVENCAKLIGIGLEGCDVFT